MRLVVMPAAPYMPLLLYIFMGPVWLEKPSENCAVASSRGYGSRGGWPELDPAAWPQDLDLEGRGVSSPRRRCPGWWARGGGGRALHVHGGHQI